MSFSRLLKHSNATSMSLSRSLRLGTRPFHVSAIRSVLYSNADLDTFTKTISQKDRITVVDFYADWCGPCKTLSPVLEQFTEEPNASKDGSPFDLVKIDVDTPDGQALGQQFNVSAIPTVVAFRDGAPLDQFKGALPPASVKRFLEELK